MFSPSWLWDMVSGSYQGKTLNQVGAGAQLEVGKWQDFTLHMRQRLGPTSYGGVVLRAADQFQGDFLYVQLDSTDGGLEGFRADQTDADFGFTGLVTANAKLPGCPGLTLQASVRPGAARRGRASRSAA